MSLLANYDLTGNKNNTLPCSVCLQLRQHIVLVYVSIYGTISFFIYDLSWQLHCIGNKTRHVLLHFIAYGD